MKNGKTYPRTGDTQTVYLKSVVTRPTIEVGDLTIYNDFVIHLDFRETYHLALSQSSNHTDLQQHRQPH